MPDVNEKIIRDLEGDPAPQVYDETAPEGSKFQVLQGKDGIQYVRVKDGQNEAQGAKADAAADSDDGAFSLISLFKRSLQILTAIKNALLGTLGVSGTVSVDNLPATQAASSADGADVTQGAKADAEAGADLAAGWSVVSLLKGILAKLRGTQTVNISGATYSQTPGSAVAGKEAALLGGTDGTNASMLILKTPDSDSAVGSMTNMRLMMYGLEGAVGTRLKTVNTGQLVTTLKNSAGAEPDINNYSGLNGQSGSRSTLSVGAFNRLSNGSTSDLQYNNTTATLLASAARTTAASATLTNYNGKGALLILNVTIASGTGGLTVRFRVLDPASGQSIQLNAAPTAIVATGRYAYELLPGAATAGSAGSSLVQQRTQGGLYRDISVLIDVGDASSYTYSLGALTSL